MIQRIATQRPEPEEKREGLCPFEWNSGYLVAQPQRTFKPKGLLLWNVPDRLKITMMVIGAEQQLLVSYGPIPAKWFAAYDSFAQIAAALDAGKEPAAWGDWDTVLPDMLIRLSFDLEPCRDLDALMWGLTLQ